MLEQQPLKFNELVHYCTDEIIKKKGWQIQIPLEWVDLVLQGLQVALESVRKYEKATKDAK